MLLDEVRRLLSGLSIPDREVLQRSGLSKLAGNFVAYPIGQGGGKKLLILIPSGTSVVSAARLSLEELASRIVVLQQAGAKWMRLELEMPQAAPPQPVVTAAAVGADADLIIVDD